MIIAFFTTHRVTIYDKTIKGEDFILSKKVKVLYLDSVAFWIEYDEDNKSFSVVTREFRLLTDME